jgi:hypothetical protein
MRLTVYVPKLAALPAIQPGTAIIGSPAADRPGKLLLDYQDTDPEAQPTRFADRVLHAASRHLTGDTTGSRLLADPDDLLVVGSFNPATGTLEVSNSEALEAWLTEAHQGTIPDLDAETDTTAISGSDGPPA